LLTATLTVAQFVFPQLLSALQRSPEALSGQWWRLISPIAINRGGLPEITGNLIALCIIGTWAESLFGSKRWVVLYLVGGFVGEVAGLAWRPVGAGASVAICGLLGGIAVWLLGRTRPRYSRVLGVLILVGALALTWLHNLHGPTVFAGALVALLGTRRDVA
jgi:rhomboid protease GluP